MFYKRSPEGVFYWKLICRTRRMGKITNTIKDTKGELKHVNWPTTGQTAAFTALIIALSILTAAFLGFFDFIFVRLLDMFVI